MPQTPLADLIELRKRITDPNNWTQGDRGSASEPGCLLGKIDDILGAPGASYRSEAVAILAATIRKVGMDIPNPPVRPNPDATCVARFNNTHTHAQVQAIVERAISAERARWTGVKTAQKIGREVNVG